MPQVSIVMPAYNAENTIKEAISSVLNQTYTDFELIIIDDCSLDATSGIIQTFDDPRIQYIKNPNNMGASESRNKGIACAKGCWIAFLDSDDFWDHTKLEKQMQLHINNSDAVISYTASSFINADGLKSSYILEAEEKVSYKLLLKKNILSCSSIMVRADVMKQIKMPGDRMSEDYYCWLTILKQFPFAYGINEPLLTYRISTNSKSSNRLKAARMTYNTYKAVGYSHIGAMLLTLRYAVYSISKRHRIGVFQ